MGAPDGWHRIERQEALPFLPKAPRHPEHHRPWSLGQVRVAGSWPTFQNLPVSVALSPTAECLAVSVGQQLHVARLSGHSVSAPQLWLACAVAPRMAWSPDGAKLAFRDDDGIGRLLDMSGTVPTPDGQAMTEAFGPASAMAFAPSGDRIAVLAPSLAGRMALTLRGPDLKPVWGGTLPRDTLPRNLMPKSRLEGVNLAWSPDGKLLACTVGTPTVWLIDAADGRELGRFEHHSLTVTGLTWIDDDWIASASADATLQRWRPDGEAPPTVVEAIPAAGMIYVHEQDTALIWSAGGELFAWSMGDTPTQLWYRDPPSRSVAAHFTRLAVSATNSLLALVDAGATDLVLVSDWNQTASTPASSTTYANAKVLLLGDSGVGKSALAMVLAGEDFRPTESTHGRRIWPLPLGEEPRAGDGEREVLLWDLAGQTGYRIVHQLHLGGAALALILFDSKSEIAPLAGVRYWARAVRHAHPVAAGELVAFLVAARTDRGGITVSMDRIQQLMTEFALDDYFETSAREGRHVDQLRSRILAAIDWERMSRTTSTALFAAVKQFVKDQAKSNLLTPLDKLRQAFQEIMPNHLEATSADHAPGPPGANSQKASPTELSAVFDGCVERLESAGLVKRLKFSDYVLLQPELLDAYAGAIVNAARAEPDGLGCILESKVIGLDFPIPSAGRPPPLEEQMLVLATLQELVQSELVLREPTEDGVQLVFPSEYRLDLPASEAPSGNGVVFRFEGPIRNVWATLIVRLTRSDRFARRAIWQSAARFAADVGECTIYLKSEEEAAAELWIGYDAMPVLLQVQFERFVHAHLDRRATPGTVVRERQYSCPDDGTAFTTEQVDRRRERGQVSILCPVCERSVSLSDDYQPTVGTDGSTDAMDASADRGLETDMVTTVLRSKEQVEVFDVFLCHNGADKPAVRDIARRLRERGLRPWLDERELRPGISWQPEIEDQIKSVRAAAIIFGSQMGSWQAQELAAFLQQRLRRDCPIIPVLLPNVERPELPVFLESLTWVDMAKTNPDPIDQLEWGITGNQPDR